MNIGTRKILDRSFTALGIGSIVVMAIALLIVLVPIVSNGIGAICFTGTVEHRKMLLLIRPLPLESLRHAHPL